VRTKKETTTEQRFEIPTQWVEALRDEVLAQIGGPPEAEPWINVRQAAEHLACTESRIYQLCSQREIPFCKDGSRSLFRRSELDAWVRAGGARRERYAPFHDAPKASAKRGTTRTKPTSRASRKAVICLAA